MADFRRLGDSKYFALHKKDTSFSQPPMTASERLLKKSADYRIWDDARASISTIVFEWKKGEAKRPRSASMQIPQTNVAPPSKRPKPGSGEDKETYW